MNSMMRPSGVTLAIDTISHTTTRQQAKKGDKVHITDRNGITVNVAVVESVEWDDIKKQNNISLRMIA